MERFAKCAAQSMFAVTQHVRAQGGTDSSSHWEGLRKAPVVCVIGGVLHMLTCFKTL